MTETLIQRLSQLESHLSSLDSASGEAKLLREAIEALAPNRSEGDLREKLVQLKEVAGREMDYGSKSDALQNAYILATEALQIMGSTVAGAAIDALGGLDTAVPTPVPLLSCPFCGNAAEVTFWDDDDGTNGYYPRCSYCTCEIEGLYTREESINAWNKRAGHASSEISVKKYSLQDFKLGLVRIDFRNHTVADIRLLRQICETAYPGKDGPAYTFGAAYFGDDARWYEGASHQLIGNKFDIARVDEIDLIPPVRELSECKHEMEYLGGNKDEWFRCRKCGYRSDNRIEDGSSGG
jgi:hypothetical protein